MSKRTRILLISLCFALALFSVVTYGFMFRTTDTTTSEFVPGTAAVSFVENNTKVKNDGNTSAYIRVRFVAYCKSGENIVGVNSPELTFTDATGWVASAANTPGCYTWYYNNPVAVDGQVLIPTFTKATVDGYTVVVEVFAESIQANPIDAVLDAWGVIVNKTTITSAP